MSYLTHQEITTLINAPLDRAIELALIDAYTTCEPSEWEYALNQLRPWYHIAALMVAVLNKEDDEFQHYINIFKTYCPKDKTYIDSAAAIIRDVSDSLELDNYAKERCNSLIQICLYASSQIEDDMGKWSI